ncbi:MAG: hypothetical protein NC489_47095 [Ruminococcus flavefaciens]|nr:hypothetical protein [Ruminococcus flavefaciens]
MKKVLIVSYYFPPVEVIAAKRFGTMCKYFEENGYKPYVLTTKPYGNWGVDAGMKLELPIDKEQIIRIGTNRTNGAIENTPAKYLVNFLVRHKYSSRTISAIEIGWYEKVKNNIDLTKLCDIDIIIATYPTMGALYIANYLSRKLKCSYIADIRDLISDYSEMEQGFKRTNLLDRMIESYILGKADGIVTVTSGFRDILKPRYPNRKFCVVYNGWDSQKKEVGGTGDEKYLYYAGSLYFHRLESCILLIRCIVKLNDGKKEKVKLVIRSVGPEKLDRQLRHIVQQNGVQDDVSVLDAADESIVREEQERAYINVVFGTIHEEDSALMTTVPGKVYELLNTQPPILAIAPRRSEMEKVLHYTNKGMATIAEDEMISFIEGGCESYRGNKNIYYFTRKKQAQRLCRFMDKVLGL